MTWGAGQRVRLLQGAGCVVEVGGQPGQPRGSEREHSAWPECFKARTGGGTKHQSSLCSSLTIRSAQVALCGIRSWAQ